MKYSCIIPVYNEYRRIAGVLKTVTQIQNISEIICVDDGSTDNSSLIIEKNFPQVTLIQHPSNLGKTSAVMTGLDSAKYDNLILLDSDLINVRSREIDRAVYAFEHNGIDCLLLNTAPMNAVDNLLRPVFRFLLLAAGNRIIKKQVLRDAELSGNVKNYQLEIAQNKYLMENSKKVSYFDISAVDVSKISKEGFVKGIRAEIGMWGQIVDYAGFPFFLKQSLFFARNRVS